jgi:transcriptional regulator with XRE-family HTH domain
MILKQLCLSRLLSQEQLAQMSGLSVRTIQRIESGHSASLESFAYLFRLLVWLGDKYGVWYDHADFANPPNTTA